MDLSDLKAKERIIRDRRTIDAVRNNLMGLTGKLGTIARWLGQPIIRQGSGLYDVYYIPDHNDLPMDNDTSMPTFNDEMAVCEGFHFDGLSRGYHFEVCYSTGNTRLTASYKGYPVYDEYAGDLFCYVPNPDWEEKIVDVLYKEALIRTKNPPEDKAQKTSIIKKFSLIIDEMKLRWGL